MEISPWAEPGCTGLKKRRAHSPYNSFTTVAHALGYWKRFEDNGWKVKSRSAESIAEEEEEKEGWRLSPDASLCLASGQYKRWKMAMSRKPESVPHGFQSSSLDDSAWMDIELPISWQCLWTPNGEIDPPIYTNMNYPFESSSPKPPEDNPTACFRLTFQWEALEDKPKSFLVFEGVESSIVCYLNDSFVGFSQDSRLPAEFDITGKLVQGANTLACVVPRFSSGSYLEDQDHWRLGGIYRNVHIVSKPASFISDFHCIPSPESNSIRAVVELELDRKSELEYKVKFSVFSTDGKEISSASGNVKRGYDKGFSTVEVVVLLEEFQYWSHEEPCLYIGVLQLERITNGTVEMVDCESCRLGFRQVRIDKERLQLLLNNEPLRINGVNRHEHSDRTGKAVSLQSMWRDAVLMKRSGFNAVRCSHYPCHHHFYDICDSLGLLVVDEANIETHAFRDITGYPTNELTRRQEWSVPMLDRVVNMFERDKNHPSIIIWSLGNECGFAPIHMAMSHWLRARDAQRVVQYEGGTSTTPATEIICPMYARVSQIEGFLKEFPHALDRPVILCEYEHAMGNSGGSTYTYWDAVDRWPWFQGGFIWDWVDQGLDISVESMDHTKSRNSLLSTLEDGFGISLCPKAAKWKYGGDFGEKSSDFQFCINGICWPDRSAKPQLLEAQKCAQPISFHVENAAKDSLDLILDLRIENKFLFTVIEKQSFGISYQISSYGGIIVDTTTLEIEPFVGPQKTENFRIRVPLSQLKDCGEVFLNLTATQINTPEYPCRDKIVAREQRPLSNVLLELQLLENIRTTRHGTADIIKDLSNRLEEMLEQKECDASTLCKHLQASFPPVSIDDTGAGLVISSSSVGFTFSLCKKTAQILEWQHMEKDMGAQCNGFWPCLARASTDNDKGGSHHAAWEKFALFDLKKQVDEVAYSLDDERGVVVISIRGEMAGKENFCCDVHKLIAITGDGNFVISQRMCPRPFDNDGFLSYGRVGLSMRAPAGHRHVAWYGRGPHECYPDRKASAHVGAYKCEVDKLHVPYIVPGECGGRTEIRHVSFSDSTGQSLSFIPGGSTPYLHFNASRHGLAKLMQAKHDSDLWDSHSTEDGVSINIDAFHMGLGGYDSWTQSVDPLYLVDPTIERKFTVCILASTQSEL